MAKRQDRGEYGPKTLMDTWDAASQQEREKLLQQIGDYIDQRKAEQDPQGTAARRAASASAEDLTRRLDLSARIRARKQQAAEDVAAGPGPRTLEDILQNGPHEDRQVAIEKVNQYLRSKKNTDMLYDYRQGAQKPGGAVEQDANVPQRPTRSNTSPGDLPAYRPYPFTREGVPVEDMAQVQSHQIPPGRQPVSAEDMAGAQSHQLRTRQAPSKDEMAQVDSHQLPTRYGEFLRLRNGRPPGTATSEGSSFTEPDALTQRVGRMDQSGAEREMRGLVRDTKGTNDILREYYDKYGQVPDSIEYDIYGNPVPRYSASSVARIKNRLTLRRMAAEAQNAEEQAAGVDPQSRRLDLAAQAEARRAASDAQRNELAVQDMELKQRQTAAKEQQTAAKEKAAADEKANQAGVGLGVLMTSTNPDVAAFRDMYTRAQESGDLSGAPASVYDQALQGGATFLSSIAGRDSKDPFARPLNQNVVEATTNALAPLMERIRQEREKAQAAKNSFADQTAQADVMIDQELQNVLAQQMQLGDPGAEALSHFRVAQPNPQEPGGMQLSVGQAAEFRRSDVANLTSMQGTGTAPIDRPLLGGMGLQQLTAVPTSAITSALLAKLLENDTPTSRALTAIMVGVGNKSTQEQLKNILVRKYGIAMNDLMFRMGASDDRWRAILEDTMRSVKGNKRAEPSKFVPAPRQ